MTLRTRVFLLLVGLVLVMLVAVWTMATGGVLRPLMNRVVRERVELAVSIAEQVEDAEDPRERFEELTERLEVRGHFAPTPPPQVPKRTQTFHLRGREVLAFRGPGSPIAVPVQGRRGRQGWMVLVFPSDLDAPARRVGLGLLVLALGGVGAGFVVVQWMLRPLEVASEAMARVADGDLGHRAPAGSDAAGRMGGTFNRMADRVQGLITGQRELMAAVSHELRTPLSRMRLQAELLREAGADPVRLDALEKDIADVDALVEELLESARLDQGFIALRIAPVDMAALAAEALGSVDLGDRELRLDLPPGFAVQADARRLLRVLTNLLSNAARYTPADATIHITGQTLGEESTLEVADNGPGVPPEALDRLFDPFFRIESSRSRRTGGLGLGLMLCRQIAEAHGGRIVARNREGGGLALRLTLPAHPPGPPPT